MSRFSINTCPDPCELNSPALCTTLPRVATGARRSICIGTCAAVASAHVQATAKTLRDAGEQVYEIGVIAPQGDGAAVMVS